MAAPKGFVHVLFNRKFEKFQKGDDSAFPPERAKALIDGGIAVLYPKPKPEAKIGKQEEPCLKDLSADQTF